VAAENYFMDCYAVILRRASDGVDEGWECGEKGIGTEILTRQRLVPWIGHDMHPQEMHANTLECMRTGIPQTWFPATQEAFQRQLPVKG
jgi:hypothetical protein